MWGLAPTKKEKRPNQDGQASSVNAREDWRSQRVNEPKAQRAEGPIAKRFGEADGGVGACPHEKRREKPNKSAHNSEVSTEIREAKGEFAKQRGPEALSRSDSAKPTGAKPQKKKRERGRPKAPQHKKPRLKQAFNEWDFA